MLAMMGTTEIVLILLAAIILVAPTVICAWLAKRKGRNPAVWAILGLFFVWAAVIVLALLPSKPTTFAARF